MEKIKITKDNFEGYCELYKSFYFTEEENKQLGKSIILSLIALMFALVGLPILQAPSIIIALGSITGVVLVVGTFLKTCYDINKTKKSYITSKYPNIDMNVSYQELEKALEKANILKYNVNKEDYTLDTEEYRKYIEAEKIKNETIEEYRFEPIYSSKDFDNKISNEELERAKVKVKKMF